MDSKEKEIIDLSGIENNEERLKRLEESLAQSLQKIVARIRDQLYT